MIFFVHNFKGQHWIYKKILLRSFHGIIFEGKEKALTCLTLFHWDTFEIFKLTLYFVLTKTLCHDLKNDLISKGESWDATMFDNKNLNIHANSGQTYWSLVSPFGALLPFGQKWDALNSSVNIVEDNSFTKSAILVVVQNRMCYKNRKKKWDDTYVII